MRTSSIAPNQVAAPTGEKPIDVGPPRSTNVVPVSTTGEFDGVAILSSMNSDAASPLRHRPAMYCAVPGASWLSDPPSTRTHVSRPICSTRVDIRFAVPALAFPRARRGKSEP